MPKVQAQGCLCVFPQGAAGRSTGTWIPGTMRVASNRDCTSSLEVSQGINFVSVALFNPSGPTTYKFSAPCCLHLWEPNDKRVLCLRDQEEKGKGQAGCDTAALPLELHALFFRLKK